MYLKQRVLPMIYVATFKTYKRDIHQKHGYRTRPNPVGFGKHLLSK